MQIRKQKQNRMPFWSIAFWIFLWQFVSMALNKQILLASPLSVGRCLLLFVQTKGFWSVVWFSFRRILSGFLLAAGSAIFFSALAYKRKRIRELLALPVAVLKATPVASFIVLILIWMSSKNLSIAISFIMAFPMIYTSLLEGFSNIDVQMLQMAQVFQMSHWKKIYYIYFAGLLPYFRSACESAIGMAWKAGIAAEIIGIPNGSIGERLYEAKIYLQTPELFAWTITIIGVSILSERLFAKVLSLTAWKLKTKK